MSQPVKIGIAGTGFGRKVALPVYSELDEFEPVACWSRTPEKAEKMASEAGIPLATSDFDEFLEAPG
ncbi:MAG: Gfo/Idh/MocA family oxidoreductase, partial [Actinomycetota bacterium]